jgi:hypothetical protein
MAPFPKLDQGEQFVDALAAQRGWHLVDQAVKVEVLEYGQTVIDARLLKHDTEAPAHLQRLTDDIEAGHRHTPGVLRHDGAQDMDEGRFPCAVGTEQREQFVGPDRQADAVKRDRAAATFRQIFDLDDCGWRCGRRGGNAVFTIHMWFPSAFAAQPIRPSCRQSFSNT